MYACSLVKKKRIKDGRGLNTITIVQWRNWSLLYIVKSNFAWSKACIRVYHAVSVDITMDETVVSSNARSLKLRLVQLASDLLQSKIPLDKEKKNNDNPVH